MTRDDPANSRGPMRPRSGGGDRHDLCTRQIEQPQHGKGDERDSGEINQRTDAAARQHAIEELQRVERRREHKCR